MKWYYAEYALGSRFDSSKKKQRPVTDIRPQVYHENVIATLELQVVAKGLFSVQFCAISEVLNEFAQLQTHYLCR